MMAIAPIQPNLYQPKKKSVYYPTRDGKPMGETDKHIDLIVYVKSALLAYFADRPDVYIAGNNLLYYVEDFPKKCVSPDCYVVFGVEMRQRDSYMVWEEGGRTPDVVFEFTSKSTHKQDKTVKTPLYERVLKISEYFLFDPTSDYLKPNLQGFRLVRGRYEPIPLVDDRLHSEVLGLDLVREGETMRLYNPSKGEWLRSLTEAEAEIEKLKAELERLRGHNLSK